jgi:hypothetical protein
MNEPLLPLSVKETSTVSYGAVFATTVLLICTSYYIIVFSFFLGDCYRWILVGRQLDTLKAECITSSLSPACNRWLKAREMLYGEGEITDSLMDHFVQTYERCVYKEEEDDYCTKVHEKLMEAQVHYIGNW